MGAGYDLHTIEGWEGLRKTNLVLYVLEYVHREYNRVIYIYSNFEVKHTWDMRDVGLGVNYKTYTKPKGK